MPSRDAFASGIADFACPRCGATALWQLRDPLRRRSNSTTTFATCGACGERGFLKLIRGDDGVATETARQEFEATTDVYRRFPPDPWLGSAAPWHLSRRLVVFACVAGKSPAGALRSGPMDEAARLAAAMGRWLALFHGCDDRQPAEKPKSFASRLETLQECWRDSPSAPKSALAGLSALTAPQHALVTRLVRQHGDAKPGNFLYDGHMLVGIDMDGRHWNVPARLRWEPWTTRGCAGWVMRWHRATPASHLWTTPYWAAIAGSTC